MSYNRQEALRYFGAREPNQATEELLDMVYASLQPSLQPKYCYSKFSCAVDAVQGTVILDTRVVLHSKNLARQLKGCREVFLFGATLGSAADVALRRLTVSSVAQGAAAQAICAAVIESYCNASCRAIGQTLPQGQLLLPRFSPGYGDWSLEEQKQVCALLDCAHRIGLTLTDSLMLAPLKSVTALIGITTEVQCALPQCALCTKTDCEFRRSEGNK